MDDKVIAQTYNSFEIARIFGEPRDPRRLFSNLIEATCETQTAMPDDYYYYFDALLETDKVYVITGSGALTQENVVPDTPVQLSFTDLASPEYWIKITDLASAKEATVARKLQTINRSMNFYENYRVVQLLDAAATGMGNTFTRSSGNVMFTYDVLINMVHALKDYADNFALVVGSTIDKQIDLWEYEENKYHSLEEALRRLNVEIIRVKETVSIDGSSTSVLDADTAYLVGRNTEMGMPLLFVRKELDSINLLGATIQPVSGDRPQRLVFASPNPVTVVSGPTRYLAIGVTGYEQFTMATKNAYAIAKYTDV